MFKKNLNKSLSEVGYESEIVIAHKYETLLVSELELFED